MKFSSPTSSIKTREQKVLLKSTHNVNATYKLQITETLQSTEITAEGMQGFKHRTLGERGREKKLEKESRVEVPLQRESSDSLSPI